MLSWRLFKIFIIIFNAVRMYHFGVSELGSPVGKNPTLSRRLPLIGIIGGSRQYDLQRGTGCRPISAPTVRPSSEWHSCSIPSVLKSISMEQEHITWQGNELFYAIQIGYPGQSQGNCARPLSLPDALRLSMQATLPTSTETYYVLPFSLNPITFFVQWWLNHQDSQED